MKRPATSPHAARGSKVALTVFACELRRLVRDRRALFAAVVLPMLLYPLLFLGSEQLRGQSQTKLGERTADVLVLGSSFSPGLLVDVVAALGEEQLHLRLAFDPAPAPNVEEAPALLEEHGAVVLVAAVPAEPPGTHERVLLASSSTGELAAEATRRVTEALEGLESRLRLAHLERILGTDPGAAEEPELVDLASEDDTRGLALGRLLPLIAALALLSGGSMAALDAFAGEREARTLETLLVQPVAPRDLAWGKFGAVLATGLAALLGNGLSLVLCAAAGLGSLPGAESAGGVPPLRLALGALVFLPAAVLLCAALCLACARARSYREGQHYVLPLTLLALLPAGLATVASVELDNFWAAVPVAGQALALREALVGRLALVPALLSVLAGSAWAALALRSLSSTLDAERLLALGDSAGPRSRRTSRAALAWGFGSVLVVYLVGGWLQSRDLVLGLSATLWVLVPALTLGAARSAVKRGGLTWRRALGLAPAGGLRRLPALVLGALCLAPALAAGVRGWLELQSEFLPLPGADDLGPMAALFDQPLGLLLFLLALSPGIQEELLFRGAIQSGLARDLPPGRVVLWQALLFGLVHASVYRFVPTAALGAVLAALTLRAGSVLPAIALHVAYNALATYGALRGAELAEATPLFEWTRAAWLPALALPGLALLAWAGRRPSASPRA